MKSSILLSFVLLSFVACKKDALVAPAPAPLKYGVVTALTTSTDTVPDKSAFKIKLVKDSNNYDETLFLFDKTASLTYNADKDAAYFTGFGQETLSSISTDGQNLAIYRLPFTPGMSIPLDVESQKDAAYTLSISYQKQIPANVHIWITDAYLNTSVDVSVQDYKFNVVKADYHSYGNSRFCVVLKDNK